MSRENVELFRGGMEAFLRHDIEPLLEISHPEIEWFLFSARVEGDVVMALGHLRAQFRSGITLDTEVGWVVRFRDGLAVWGRAYQSHAEAIEAAGFSG